MLENRWNQRIGVFIESAVRIILVFRRAGLPHAACLHPLARYQTTPFKRIHLIGVQLICKIYLTHENLVDGYLGTCSSPLSKSQVVSKQLFSTAKEYLNSDVEFTQMLRLLAESICIFHGSPDCQLQHASIKKVTRLQRSKSSEIKSKLCMTVYWALPLAIFYIFLFVWRNMVDVTCTSTYKDQ